MADQQLYKPMNGELDSASNDPENTEQPSDTQPVTTVQNGAEQEEDPGPGGKGDGPSQQEGDNHEGKGEVIEEKIELELHKLQLDGDTAVREHDSELEQLKEQHLHELENVRVAIKVGVATLHCDIVVFVYMCLSCSVLINRCYIVLVLVTYFWSHSVLSFL